MAKLVKTDRTVTVIPVPSLEEAQRLIGGWVELVRPRHAPSVVFLCDEDGHRKGLPVNLVGCVMYGSEMTNQENGFVSIKNAIVGDIIVMTRAEAKSWLE